MNKTAYLVATVETDGKVKIGIYSEKKPSVELIKTIKQVIITQTKGQTYDEARDRMKQMILLDL